ncbi:MAG: hypothetical protein ACW99A_05575 [Candidatus Kariarchaeaceae archaeon]
MNFNRKVLMVSFMILCGSFSIGFVPSSSYGEGTILPVIDGNGPQLNGNLTAGWEDSVKFKANFKGEDANVFVQVNGSHIFVGFNYTIENSPFISVNDTLPVNTTLTYNNATHDWLALQFDNNLDQENIGTDASPDDVITVDQYRNETYDGFIQGNDTHPFLRDDNVTIGGTEDSSAFRSNYSEFRFINDIDQVEDFTTVYEFTKPLASNDVNGFDINVPKTNILQFKFIYWMNQSANATIDTSLSTDWFTFRLNDTGTGVSTKGINETRIDLLIDNDDIGSFQAFSTILDEYGFDFTTLTNSSFIDPVNNDLSIVILNEGTGLTLRDIQILVDSVKIGGSLIIFLNSGNSISASVADLFSLTYLSNNLIVPGTDNETEGDSVFNASPTDLPFVSELSSVTTKSVVDFDYSSSAFNISGLNDKSEYPFILSQDYHLYDLFDLPTNIVYDENNDGLIGGNETKNDVSAGLAFDFLNGGRLALFPSSEVISNNNLTDSDFLSYLLRLLPWNAKNTNTLKVASIDLNTHNINRGDKINVNINITDEFGNNIDNSISLNVTSQLVLGSNVIATTTLAGTGSIYSGELEVQRTGFMILETYVFFEGYGFAVAEEQNVLSESSVNNFNDLESMSNVLLVLFSLSLIMILLVYRKTK